MIPVITIDGPGGAGKGTISQMLAQHLGWHFLDSGAIYRLCGLACLQAQINLEDESAVLAIANALDIRFVIHEGHLQTWLGQEEVSDKLRTETTASAASKIAVMGSVRDALLARQQAFAQMPGLIADGRDMGTVVFPAAPLKIYLTASAEERAKRRAKQLQEQGRDVNIARILADISERDARDMQRTVAPLKPADGAVIIDSSDLSAAEVFEQVLALLQQRHLV